MDRQPLTPSTNDFGKQMSAKSKQKSANESTDDPIKVVLIGAAGRVGQPLALLLKRDPEVAHLALYGRTFLEGMAMDLSHINSPTQVVSFHGISQLSESLTNSSIVVFLASTSLLPGMTRNDLFEENARIITPLAQTVAHSCPKAMVAVVSNPLNSLLPLVAELHPYPKRVFGVTTLDVVRAATFLAEHFKEGQAMRDIIVPVVGGHCLNTIIPLFSQAHPSKYRLSDSESASLVERVRMAGRLVVEANKGKGSATLSTAHATFTFVKSLIRAIKGEKVVECAYVKLSAMGAISGADRSGRTTDTSGASGSGGSGRLGSYFASPVTIGTQGVEEFHHEMELSPMESLLMERAIPLLKSDIDKAYEFLRNNRQQ